MLMIKVDELGKRWYLDRNVKFSKDGKREKSSSRVHRLCYEGRMAFS